jgi:hypothetical protein
MSACSPSSARRPLTVTLPSRINSSASRREQTPARAMSFCSRSRLTGTFPGDLLHLLRRGERGEVEQPEVY